MSDVRIDSDENGMTQLYVSGEIDLTNAADIATIAIKHAPANGEIVLNLASVTYFDTTGIKMLLELTETLGGRLTIVPSARVLKILDIIGLRNTLRLRIEHRTDGAPEIRDRERIQLSRQDEGCVE